jgi:integrase
MPKPSSPRNYQNFDMHPTGTVRLDPGTTKNKEGRLIYLTPDLRSLLARQRTLTIALQKEKERIIPLVFHDHGYPIVNYDKRWREACKRAGVPGKLVHDFRRTAVRNMVRAGIPERVAMQMTGHKTRSIFDRYDIVSEADLKGAAQKLADALASQMLTEMVTVTRITPSDSAVSA